MKKLLFLLIATSLFIGISATNSFAGDPAPTPVIESLDRHAVWTNSSTVGQGNADSKTTKMTSDNGKANPFSFIRETKSYDYSKDGKRA